MLSIHCAVRLTRRRTINQVLDEKGTLEFSAESLAECIGYINSYNQEVVAIHDTNDCWFLVLKGWAEAPAPWVSCWDLPQVQKLLAEIQSAKQKNAL